MKTPAALALLASALAAATPATAQQVALQPDETLLEVQAEGTARYLPDAAFTSIGVVSTGSTAREATDANARQMASVIDAVRQAGVADRYLRTQQINVQPRFARMNASDYEGQAQITGYVANNTVAVTVTRLAAASDVIAAAFGAGANSVSGPNLGSEDPAKGLAQARAAAVATARSQAENYARGLGMRVARVLRVSERGNRARQIDFVLAEDVGMFPPSQPAPPPPIAKGEMKRTATIWIDYALVPAN